MLDPVLIDVRRKMAAMSLSLADSAAEIGVGVASLQKHLAGEYVRSDSIAKYRRWLGKTSSEITEQASQAIPAMVQFEQEDSSNSLDEIRLTPELTRDGLLNVVDLFCGCGGMSLGFERFQNSNVFRTTLALDIEAPMVRVFNDNHHSDSPDIGIARQVDITDFTNEAEVQAFYLEHLGRTSGDEHLLERLGQIGTTKFHTFRQSLAKVDSTFLNELSLARREDDYFQSIRKLGSGSLGQTSVVGFHNALKLPATTSTAPNSGR